MSLGEGTPDVAAAARLGPYAGQRCVLATMHGKETAIAPVLLGRLGLVVTTAPNIDTDALGTFTGEIPRAGTIREAAVAKARLGMNESITAPKLAGSRLFSAALQ